MRLKQYDKKLDLMIESLERKAQTSEPSSSAEK